MAVDAGGPSAEFFSNLFEVFFADVCVAGADEAPHDVPRQAGAWPLFERGGHEGKLLPYLPPEVRPPPRPVEGAVPAHT